MSDCDFGVQATVVTRQRVPKPVCKPSDKEYTNLQGGHNYGINQPLTYVDAGLNQMRPFVKGDAKVHGIRTCAVDLTDLPETEFCEMSFCNPCCCNKDVISVDVNWPSLTKEQMEGMSPEAIAAVVMTGEDVLALNATARVNGDCCAFNFIDIPCNTHSTLPCIETAGEEKKAVA